MNKKILIASLLIIYAGFSAFLAGILSQAIMQYLMWLKSGSHGMYSININLKLDLILANLITKPGIVLFTSLQALFIYLYIKFINQPTKDKRNFHISKQGTYGTAGWMDMKEAKNVLEICDTHHQTGVKNYQRIRNNIPGRSDRFRK